MIYRHSPTNLIFLILALFVAVLPSCQSVSAKPTIHKKGSFKGWDYIANRLLRDGVPRHEVYNLFSSRLLPRRPFVPFAAKPRESQSSYNHFLDKRYLKKAKNFLNKYRRYFDLAERAFDVDREVIASILLVETKFGSYTGKHRVIIRILRAASVAEPSNIEKNYKRLLKKGEKVTRQQITARAKYVQDIFYPEILALLRISRNLKLNIFNIRGSIAGAFGLPQFMPSSYITYAVDGNKDGRVSLFNEGDAILSVGNYFSKHGWRFGAPDDVRKKAIWGYNKSSPYVNTVLKLFKTLKYS